jgi:acyl-CoA hydrolase
MTESPKGRHPKESWVEMTELVLPQHTNARDTAFGGTIVSWVDIAAATCAMRHCNSAVVTASIDAMHFLAPVKRGWIVNIFASVNYTATTSCEVGVKVLAENPITKEKHHTASAYVTMVALDHHGKPTKVPPIIPENDKEKERMSAATERRKYRLETRNRERERVKRGLK